jgi:hypothetical protein
MIPAQRQLGVVSAKNRTVQDTAWPGPNMRSTVQGFMRPVTLTLITKTLVDREYQEVQRQVNTLAVIMPFSGAQLVMKPEGQRSWNWSTLITTTDLVLKNDDVVIYRGVINRVMRNQDFSAYGQMEYELVSGFTNDAPPKI